jgi:phosphatidylglycerophosphate synthase
MNYLINFIPNSDHYIFNHNYIINKFKYIHPNYITILGFISNILVIYFYYYKNIVMFSFFTIIRSICDILDGLVARKFNKVTYLGGILDTISDTSFLTIILFIILKCYLGFKKSFILALTYFILHMYSMYYSGNLSDHSGLKNKPDTFSKLVIYFLIKNTFIIHLILLYFFKYINDKCNFF